MNQNNSKYFIQTLAIIVLSVIAFVLLKPFLPEKLFPATAGTMKNIVVDSLMLEALANQDDFTSNKTDTISQVNLPSDYVFHEPSYVGYQHLVSFFEKLMNLESTGQGKLRIAYYGDSMNDGDMIVQDFRANFQDRFGGDGVGFVNISSESSASRGTVKHEHSKKWKSYSFVNTKSLYSPFGISGNVFFPGDSTADNWVNFEASQQKNLTLLMRPSLYFGQSKNKNGRVVIVKDKDTAYKKLKTTHLLNELPLANVGKKLKIHFRNADSIPIYGVGFEGTKGVYVDNFSNRGNSGLPLSSLKPEVISAFNDKLHYDLIVLQYGTNVLSNGSKNFMWYENRMKKVVAHLQKAMPNVAIMVISIADKSTKYDTKMQTDSAVYPLVNSQLNYAKASNASFINLFELMGGEGSMVKWTDELPAKANKDYTHFNYRGSKIVADLLFNKIMDGYTEFATQYTKKAKKTKGLSLSKTGKK